MELPNITETIRVTHPKKIIQAIFVFLISTFLVWWCYGKIDIFTRFLTTGISSTMVWTTVIITFAFWLFGVPYFIITGGEINIFNIFKSMGYLFLGLIVIVIGSAIGAIIFPLIYAIPASLGYSIGSTELFNILGNLLLIIAMLFFSVYKPIEIMFNKNL